MLILLELLKAQAYVVLWELLKKAFTIEELNKGEDNEILERIKQEQDAIKQRQELEKFIDERINNNPVMKNVMEKNIQDYINNGRIKSEIVNRYDISKLC
jgi:hypothetical protein